MDNKIVETNYGLASNYGDFIEINWKIAGDLRNKMIAHENRHSRGGYDKQDFINDFKSKNSYFFESLKFAVMNPECFINFFPLMYSYYAKEWTWNESSLIPFFWFGLLTSIVFGLVFMNFLVVLEAFVGYSFIMLLINGILLAYTHYKVRKEPRFKYRVTYS